MIIMFQLRSEHLHFELFNPDLTGFTRGAGTDIPFRAPEFTPSFSGIRVAPFLVFCVLCIL